MDPSTKAASCQAWKINVTKDPVTTESKPVRFQVEASSKRRTSRKTIYSPRLREKVLMLQIKKSLVDSLLDTGYRSAGANLSTMRFNKDITKVSFSKITPCGSAGQETGRCMPLAFQGLSCVSRLL